MSREEVATRLHRQLAAMVAVEQEIDERLDELVRAELPNPEVAALLGTMREATRARAHAVGRRKQAIAPEVPVPRTRASRSQLDDLNDAELYPASAALRSLHVLFTQASIGYAVLMELAFRAADSEEGLGPENTGDLASEQMRFHTVQAKEAARLLPFAVVHELEEEGQECRCSCPACSLGICGCPLAFRRRLDMALADAGPLESGPGLRVARPRSASPAAVVGVQEGDVLITIDGTEVGSIPMLQQLIGGREPGKQIRLEIERGGEGRQEITVVRP